MIHLQIDEPYQSLIPETLLEQAARAALTHQATSPDNTLTIVLTGDETLHELNLRFMDVDAPTDVLSFPSGEPDPETGETYLGDILISYPRAEAQAQQGGHPITAELQLLTVHGTLHLLGHDHYDEEEKATMWAAQSEILQSLGSSLTVV
ncbi:MAG TPA: rRNA maturation RNase YbeY [Anaerolineales bacterium]|nr:rRNA maturation RNase YbeY [Anaerolineales bacterium]